MTHNKHTYHYSPDELREAAGIDDEVEDATHECISCQDERAHIESAPAWEYRWCPQCESITKWRRLDRMQKD